MIEIQFALGLLMLLFVWQRWRHSALDQCRDTLFDIRDAIHDRFQTEGKLDTKAYLEARETLNAMIRYTHEVTLWRVLSDLSAIKKFPHVGSSRKKITKKLQSGLTPELRAFVKEQRSLASNTLAVYLVESSALLLLSSLFAIPVVLFKRSLDDFQSAVSTRILSPFVEPKQFETFALARCA